MRLRPGKLPAAVLRRLLRYRGAADQRVLIGPRFGEDAAVVDLGRRYLVLKSDPVTFVSDEIGWYVVHSPNRPSTPSLSRAYADDARPNGHCAYR